MADRHPVAVQFAGRPLDVLAAFAKNPAAVAVAQAASS